VSETATFCRGLTPMLASEFITFGHHEIFLFSVPGKFARSVPLLTCIWKALGSNLGYET